jgi:hypothetical protein
MSVIYGDDSTRQLTGHALARKGRSASQRAAFAASLILGELELTKPTKGQIAKLLDVSIPYVERALALSPVERSAVQDGFLTLARFKNPPTDLELERVVEAAGVGRTWNVLEPMI